MRIYGLIITIILCLNTTSAQIRPAAKVNTCTTFENVIRSSFEYFESARTGEPKSYTQQEEWLKEMRQYNYKRFESYLKWPNATSNYILYKEDDVNDEIQEYTFNAEFAAVKTEAAAMALLQKVTDELYACKTFQFIDGKKDSIGKVKLSALDAKKIMYSTILSRKFPYKDHNREVWAATKISLENGSYVPAIVVRVSVHQKDKVVKKQCTLINEIIAMAYRKFNGDYTKEYKTDNKSLPNNVTTTNTEFETNVTWPQMLWRRVINNKIKSGNITRYDSWNYLTWRTGTYENMLHYYQRLYKQINECTVTSPSGKTYVLSAKYSEPSTTVSGNKSGLISFNQLFDSERIEVSIQLTFDNNTYYTQISVSKSDKN